jgi:predicted RecA/RadA family phage recombinase
MQVEFLHGEVDFVDITPDADVSAGDVIVTGDLVLIAHSDIPANTLGAAAIHGGVYRAPVNETIAYGQALMWDDTLNLAKKDTTGTVTANLGLAASASIGGYVEFYHQQGGVRN